MKNALCLAAVAGVLALGSAGAANAAVAAPKPAGDAIRSTVGSQQLVEQARWGRERVCTWRHGHRYCWWRRRWW